MAILAGTQVKMIYKTKMGQGASKGYAGGEVLSVVLVMELSDAILGEAKNMYVWRPLDKLPAMVKSALSAKLQAGQIDQIVVALVEMALF